MSSEIPVIINNGAYFSLTPIQYGFIENNKPTQINKIQGFNHQAKVFWGKLAKWKIGEIFGRTTIVKTKAHCLYEAQTFLFSAQIYFQRNCNQGTV